MSKLVIRAAQPSDAAGIAKMANALNKELDGRKGPFDELVVLRDGFGTDPAFQLIVAQEDGALAGYLLYFDFYNTNVAQRGYWLQDIYVEPPRRRNGIGQRLVAELAQRTVSTRRGCLAWSVHTGNEGARRFYRKIGAKDPEAKQLEMDGDKLWTLAAKAL